MVIRTHPLAAGSSPLTRGTRDLPISSSCRTTVHPRSRGEHLSALFLKLLDLRFIPAHAGNTKYSR